MQDNAYWEYPAGQIMTKPEMITLSHKFHGTMRWHMQLGKERLPTEIEWEHAARNGKNSRHIYPGEMRLRLKGDIKQTYGKENFHSKTPMRMVF